MTVAANADLQLSEAGGGLIRHFESCLQPVKGRPGYYIAYLDPVKVLTIGYGHTNARGLKLFQKGTVWSYGRCVEVFGLDMEYFGKHVKRLVKVPLNQHQFDALVSFTFNLGPGNFGKSTLLKRINAKDFKGAAGEFHKWNKAAGKVLRGLTRRRTSEANVFRSGYDTHYRA
jgi:lysozyme